MGNEVIGFEQQLKATLHRLCTFCEQGALHLGAIVAPIKPYLLAQSRAGRLVPYAVQGCSPSS